MHHGLVRSWVEFAKTVFSNLEVFCWDPGDPYPYHLDNWEGDWIISYRGDFIFPQSIYKNARKGAINLHPAPPKYRGLGSQHYAIYYNDETYGSTCHHLAPSVDSGQIIDVARFNVAPAETASSLRLHVGAYCLQQFIHLLTDYILVGRPLPVSPENWGNGCISNRNSSPGWSRFVPKSRIIVVSSSFLGKSLQAVLA